MHGDLVDHADTGRALLDAAKIEGAAHAQRADDLDIGSSELAKMVGAEDVPPARGPAICGRIAAEVAKIAGALQGEMAGRGILSGRVLHEISLRYGEIDARRASLGSISGGDHGPAQGHSFDDRHAGGRNDRYPAGRCRD